MRLDGADRREVRFDLKDYAQIDHGYASTIHKSQGVTVDHGHLLASDGLDRHAAYVGMSRHRETLAVHYGADDFKRPGPARPHPWPRAGEGYDLGLWSGHLRRAAGPRSVGDPGRARARSRGARPRRQRTAKRSMFDGLKLRRGGRPGQGLPRRPEFRAVARRQRTPCSVGSPATPRHGRTRSGWAPRACRSCPTRDWRCRRAREGLEGVSREATDGPALRPVAQSRAWPVGAPHRTV